MTDPNRAHRRICTFSFLLAVMLFSNTAANGADDPSAAAIPPELEVLMAGWEDNFSRIRTLQASARSHVEDARFPACKDLDNKSYPDQNVTISIWKDNAKFRTDVAFDRTYDIRNNKVQYNLPFGEYAMPTTEWEQKQEELKRQYGVLQTTTRFMQVDDAAYNYMVERNDFMIERAGKFFPGPDTCEWMWKGTLVGSRTFPEYIRSKARLASMRSFTVEDLGGGRYAVHHSFVGTADGREVSGKASLVIDATKGYTVQSIKREVDGQLLYEGEYKYANAEGVWVLVGADYRDYDWTRNVKTVQTAVSLSVDVESLRVNQPVDPQIFTVDSLGIRKGAFVRDSITGKRHLYDDIPIRLKATLAEAQQLINRPLDDPGNMPTQVNASSAEKPDSAASLSRTDPAPEHAKTDTSHATQRVTRVLGMPAVISGIVIGAAVAVAAAWLCRAKIFGGASK